MLNLKYKENKFIIDGNTYPAKDRIKSLGFNWDTIGRHWVTSYIDTDKLREIVNVLIYDEITIDDSIRSALENNLRVRKQEREDLKFQFPDLFPFQLDGILFSKDKDILIADNCGLGKTISSMVLANTYNLPVLVVAPKSIHLQWKNEIRKWLKQDSVIVQGDSTRYMQYFNSKWTIVNYEKVYKDYQQICYPEKFILICDEASKLKNRKTKIYKTMQVVCSKAYKKVFLSGTPIENRLEDYFNIIKLIDKSFMSVKDFMEKYCIMGKVWIGRFKTINVVTGYQNLEDFVKKVSSYCIRRRREDVIEQLPKLQTQIRNVDLTPLQLSTYKKIVNKAREAGKGKFEILQLLRLVADDLRLFNESESELIDQLQLRNITDEGNKIEELKEIIDDNSEKMVIFTQFVRMANIIKSELKNDAVVITGGMTDKERNLRIEEFRTNKRFLISTDTLAYGVNLQYCPIIVNFDLPWVPAVLEQRISRCYGRIGGLESYLIINLVSKGIEDRVLEVLNEKKDLFDKVVDGKIINDETVRNAIIGKFLDSDS